MSAYPDRPVVGVGVIVLRGPRAAPQVLLIRRGKAPRAGSWSLPGGRQHLGETLRQAAAREVAEETGLVIQPTTVLDAVDSMTHDEKGDLAYHYSLVDFFAFWQGGTPVAASDAAEVVWADVDDLSRFSLWSETERLIALAVAQADPARLKDPLS